MKVKLVEFDWFYTAEEGEASATCSIGTSWGYEKGKKTVTNIEYYSPKENGNRHYCDIIWDNGETLRTFNINAVIFEKEENNEKE
jgi:hypothetical protein